MDFTEPWCDTCSNIGYATRIGNVTLLLKLVEEKKPVDVADNRGWRPLHEAAATSPAIECLEILLKQEDTDVNWTTHEGETALLLACKRRQGAFVAEYVSLLLGHKADPNIVDNEEDSPLLEAVRSENLSVVELLLNAGADVNASDCSNWSPLHEAANKPDATLLQMLLKWNAIIDIQDECGMTPIFTAAQHGCEECLEALLLAAKERNQAPIVNIGAEDYATPLMIAAQQGFGGCVSILLENGADPNLLTCDNATALHLAVQGNNTVCLSMLLEKMVIHPLIQTFHPLTFEDNDSICPLHLAVEWGSHASLKALIQAGFSPDSLYSCSEPPLSRVITFLPEVETALSYAASKSDSVSMALLLEAGANPSPATPFAFHPLVRALSLNHKREFKILIESGTDLNFQRARHKTNEVFLFSFFSNLEYMRELLYYGCDPNLCFSNERTCFCKCAEFFLKREKMTLSFFVKFIWRFLLHTRNLYETIVELNSIVPDEDINDVLDELSRPSSLLQICFINLRRHLYSIHRNKLPNVVKTLCLPAQLINYVIYEDLIKPEHQISDLVTG